ncbi:putative protein kinase [Erwinia phage pEp_SNUABM_03]|nr:putative protein kinase [Erwinia phage pEp_SNUABM_03]
MTNNELTINQRAFNTLRNVRDLPIVQLELRQPMLVDIMQQIVTHYVTTYDKPVHYISGWNKWDDFKETALHAGWEYLGSGYFSAAFRNDALPGKVLKVGFKKEDSGAAYAAFCRHNQGKMGIPTIYAIERHNDCYTVVMDELKDYKHHSAEPHQREAYNMVCELVSSMGREEKERMVNAWASADLAPSMRELADTCNAIREFFTGVASFDIHSGNVMIDSKGRLIITDPVSYSNDKLEAVEFDALCGEIEAMRLERRKQVWKDRHARKHPNAELRAHLKRRAKRKRKNNRLEAKRKAKAAHEMQLLMDDPMLTGEPVLWGELPPPKNWKQQGEHVRFIKAEHREPTYQPDRKQVSEVDAIALDLLEPFERPAIGQLVKHNREQRKEFDFANRWGAGPRGLLRGMGAGNIVAVANEIHLADMKRVMESMRGNFNPIVWMDEIQFEPLKMPPRLVQATDPKHAHHVFPWWKQEPKGLRPWVKHK